MHNAAANMCTIPLEVKFQFGESEAAGVGAAGSFPKTPGTPKFLCFTQSRIEGRIFKTLQTVHGCDLSSWRPLHLSMKCGIGPS